MVTLNDSTMVRYKILNFTPEDIPGVIALQQAFQQVYPHAAAIPGEVYLSSGFENGKNIFCAFDEKECLQGYAPLFPNLTVEPQIPHTIWAEVKVNPELAAPRDLKDMLFDRVINRTRQITQAFPGRQTRLTLSEKDRWTQPVSRFGRESRPRLAANNANRWAVHRTFHLRGSCLIRQASKI